jgi:hydrogenase nickel incorporation protein HypA/HybF
MHEMAIMDGMFKLINQQVEEHQLQKVTKVKIVVGVMSGVVPESLQMCFKIMAAGTPCEGAELEIEQAPLKAHCSSCGEEYEVKNMVLLCPFCGGKVKDFTSGRQLYLEYLEGD